jgi:hypothetical protein
MKWKESLGMALGEGKFDEGGSRNRRGQAARPTVEEIESSV